MQKIESYPSNVNIGMQERRLSVLAGGAMLTYALLHPSRSSIPLVVVGSYFVYRGITGKCEVYRLMEIDRAGVAGRDGILVERTVTVNLPRPEVFDFWRNFENFPIFMKHLQMVEVQDEKKSHWVARGPLNLQVEWDAQIVEEIPNKMIAWRSLAGSEIDNSGEVWFRDAPGERGTEVEVKLRYDPPAGSASALIARLFGEEPEQQVRDDLRRFKQVMEAGEVPTTFGQTSGRLDEAKAERDEIERRKGIDVVEEASEESFPASDSPGWTKGPAV